MFGDRLARRATDPFSVYVLPLGNVSTLPRARPGQERLPQTKPAAKQVRARAHKQSAPCGWERELGPGGREGGRGRDRCWVRLTGWERGSSGPRQGGPAFLGGREGAPSFLYFFEKPGAIISLRSRGQAPGPPTKFWVGSCVAERELGLSADRELLPG